MQTEVLTNEMKERASTLPFEDAAQRGLVLAFLTTALKSAEGEEKTRIATAKDLIGRFARNAATAEEVRAALDAVGPLTVASKPPEILILDTDPVPATPISPAAAEEILPTPPAAEITESSIAAAHTVTTMMHRKGPDVWKAEPAASEISAAPEASVVPDAVVSVLEPAVSPVEPAPIAEVPAEILPSAPMVEAVAEVPRPEPAPGSVPAETAPIAAEGTRDYLREVNDINHLITKGTKDKGGSTLHFLKEPNTGYPDFVKELIEMRLGAMNVTDENRAAFEERLAHFREMGQGVMQKVGIAVPQPEVAQAAAPEVASAPVAHETESVPTETPGPIEASVPEIPQPIVLPTQEEVPQQPGMEPVTTMDSRSGVANEMIQDVLNSIKTEETPASSDVPPAAATLMSSLGSAAEKTDAMHSPAMEKALHRFLEEWLKVDGKWSFIGIGKSGTEHPTWIKFKDWTVADLMDDESKLPEQTDMVELNNIRDNIRWWRDPRNNLPVVVGEKLEDLVRRVIARDQKGS